MGNTLMSQRDRTELRRITKARFALLEQQLQQRQSEVENIIRQEIQSQYDEDITKAKEESARLGEKLNSISSKIANFEKEIVEEIDTLVAEGSRFGEQMAKKGIKPNHQYRVNNVLNPVEIDRTSWYNLREDRDYGEVFVSDDWRPVDLEVKVQSAFRELSTQAGLTSLDLGMKRLELEEELAIGALSSDEAKDFLKQIPDIDTLLPEPDEVEVKKLTK